MNRYHVRVMGLEYEVEAASHEQAAWRGVARHFAQQPIPRQTPAEVYQNGQRLGDFEVAAARSREYDRGNIDAPIDVYTLTARKVS